MERLVRAFPLLPERTDELLAFLEELEARRDVLSDWYAGFGVVRESAHVQETQAGDLMIVCTDLEKPEQAATDYAAARGEFDVWFKAKILELTGIDPNRQPLGPECRTVFDWRKAP